MIDKQRKIVETVFSGIARLFPKHIHAITSRGFELKVALFASYQPKIAETPYWVSPVESSYQWDSKQIDGKHVPGHRHKKDVEVTYTHTLQVSGGVVYRLNSQNFTTYTHPMAHDFASSALKSRPSENDFSWSFHSPTK